MSRLLQTLLDSLTVGSLYGLIALGYTMVYGILQFINFAHSDVFMLGAWFSYTISKKAGWTGKAPPLWAAPFVLIAAMGICGTIGFLIERLAYKPLRKAPRLNVLITAIGVSLLIENVGQLNEFWLPIPVVAALAFVGVAIWVAFNMAPGRTRNVWFGVAATTAVLVDVTASALNQWQFWYHGSCFGTQPQSMPQLIPERVLFTLVEVDFHLVDMLVIGVAFVLMVLLQWLVYGTKLGLGMRAVAHDTRTASLMGVDVDRVISFTFVVGSALAAAAGLLFSAEYSGLKQPADGTWVLLGLKAFVAAVVGGIGNVRGAVLGGLLIGLLEEFGVAYLSPTLRDVYVFTLLIVVLLVKPTGLLGKPIMEKV